ncbi:MAG: carbohydrate porin [Acidobacteriota bacterium]|nr:carbohydrate porin [Acidobacteriota bacterium]
MPRIPYVASCLLAVLCLAAEPAGAQKAGASGSPAAVGDSAAEGTKAVESTATLFGHSDGARWLVLGQANVVFQAHGPFHSPYAGANSLLGRGEYKTSLVGTLFLGYELRRSPGSHLEVLYNEESAGGRGISEALGLAGFTNLDVVRNPTLGPLPYLARVQVHGTVGLSNAVSETTRGPFALATTVPARRLELRIGKMGLPDFFDLNSVGSDSHLQFLNWTVDNNGAWDYAADTRGYTWAAVAEYVDRAVSVRYALAAMPAVANGIDFDFSLRRASGQNVEAEWRRRLLPGLAAERKGAVRVLGYANHAHMGDYREANAAFVSGTDGTPDITRHAAFGALKYGFGLNAEQELAAGLRVYARFGWNEGKHESFAYTEVDQTLAAGADRSGDRWGRPLDRTGLTLVSNAIKRDHQAYLGLGGLGFLLGDGRLHYAREDILEGYYTLHTWRGVFYSLDAQYVTHPGYNADRGPVLVEAVRMHVDF